jgi:monothiol glutaredoxin
MKGDPQAPRCGFSAKAVGALQAVVETFHTVDVLDDAEIRDGIKLFGSWPTIPQLYVDGELVGGSDIIEGMLNSGELHGLFGATPPDRTPPPITITERAAEAIRAAMADSGPGLGLHMAIDGRFQAQFQLKPIGGGEIVSESQGIKVHFDLASAPRAKGLEIDWVEDVRGAGLAIKNPNAPAQVQPMTVQELAARVAKGDISVIDIRPEADRGFAAFPHAHQVLDETTAGALEALPKETELAFLCHHGISSARAAEHFRAQGFSRLFNVEGGIEAWSQQIDPSVPRY